MLQSADPLDFMNSGGCIGLTRTKTYLTCQIQNFLPWTTKFRRDKLISFGHRTCGQGDKRIPICPDFTHFLQRIIKISIENVEETKISLMSLFYALGANN